MTRKSILLTLTAAALVALAAIPVAAQSDEIYTYMCNVPKDHRSYPVQINIDKATLSWRGQTFSGLRLIDGCRYNYQATRLNDTAELCTFTKGYADLKIDGSLFECRM